MPLDVPGSRLTEEERQAALVNEKWDRNDLLAIHRGVAPELEDVRQARLENQRSVQGKTLAELGPFRIVWDLCLENFFRSYDGAIPAQFDLDHPDLVVRWVSVADLRPVLHEQSRRSDAEFWAKAFASKNAGVLAHWIAGGQVTPPHIVERDGKVYVAGGNHRLFIAMLKGETHVPVLVSAAEEAALGSVVRLSLDKPGLSQP